MQCLGISICLEDGSGHIQLEASDGNLILENGLGPVGMTNDAASARKLAHKLRTCSLAVLLVNNGFRNPAQLRAASDAELKAVGVTDGQLALIREVY